MPDSSPARVPTKIDAIAAPIGRTFVEFLNTMRFASDADRRAFRDYLVAGLSLGGAPTYRQPGGDRYLQPDGTTLYLQPV